MQVTDFQWFDPNPEAVHGNPSKAIDCVVRAFCAALDRGWAEVYNELCYLGKQNHDMPMIGRSKEFMPILKKACAETLDPGFDYMNDEDFYHLVNKV